MKCAVEMGSAATMYMPSCIKIGSAFKKLMGNTQKHRQHEDRISLLSFLQIKESRL